MTTEHELKSWVGLFQPIWDGVKTHDLRVLDRDFKVGDRCLLREWDPTERTYTGRQILVEITYITSEKHVPCAFSPIALHPAMGCLSIRRLVTHDANQNELTVHGLEGFAADSESAPSQE